MEDHCCDYRHTTPGLECLEPWILGTPAFAGAGKPEDDKGEAGRE